MVRMTEIDYLKCKLEDTEKAFDKLHKRHIELLKQQGKLEKENEQLKFENETLKSNYQREIQSSIDFCNAYSKTNGELLEKIEKLEKENEQLHQKNTKLIAKIDFLEKIIDGDL